MKKRGQVQRARVSQTQVRAKIRTALPVPLKLPPLAATYGEIYCLLLKHAMRNGRISGKLFEIGPGYGHFLNMLCTAPFFTSNPKFKAAGINASLTNYMPPAAKKVTTNATVEEYIKRFPQMHGKADFVIATNVLDSPDTQPNRIFRAISLLTRKGGKVFLQTQKPEEMPSQERIKKEGFEVIDKLSLKDEHMPQDPWVAFILVLKKVR